METKPLDFRVIPYGPQMANAVWAVDYPRLVRYLVDELDPQKWKQAKAKKNLIGWFVGKGMQLTNGAANPLLLQELLEKEAETV